MPLLFLLTLLLAGGGPATAQQGPLLLVGGGRQPESLVRHFVQLSGGPDRALIAVLPMASSTPAEAGRAKVEQLQQLGARAFVLDLTRAQALTPAMADLLDGVTGVWFPGGDQMRLADVLLDTPVLEAVRARWRAGAVVAGTSAGAAVMSDSMITGAQVPAGADTAGYYGDQYPRIARRAIVLAPGFGFLSNAIVDQHFVRRERHNRLLSVVLEHPSLLGVGIDESTALQVEPDGSWRVAGSGVVVVYDARGARITAEDQPVLGAAGVLFHLLPPGSTFDPAAGRAALPTP